MHYTDTYRDTARKTLYCVKFAKFKIPKRVVDRCRNPFLPLLYKDLLPRRSIHVLPILLTRDAISSTIDTLEFDDLKENKLVRKNLFLKILKLKRDGVSTNS